MKNLPIAFPVAIHVELIIIFWPWSNSHVA